MGKYFILLHRQPCPIFEVADAGYQVGTVEFNIATDQLFLNDFKNAQSLEEIEILKRKHWPRIFRKELEAGGWEVHEDCNGHLFGVAPKPKFRSLQDSYPGTPLCEILSRIH